MAKKSIICENCSYKYDKYYDKPINSNSILLEICDINLINW